MWLIIFVIPALFLRHNESILMHYQRTSGLFTRYAREAFTPARLLLLTMLVYISRARIVYNYHLLYYTNKKKEQ